MVKVMSDKGTRISRDGAVFPVVEDEEVLLGM
jgi:hypothetical protein